MKSAKITSRAATVMMAFCFTAAAFAGDARPTYVDDQHDYVDPMVVEMAADAPDLFALPDGVEPYSIPAEGDAADKSGKTDSHRQNLSDGDGPMVNSNYIRFYIGAHANAGSAADYVILNFGRGRNMRLWGYYSGGDNSFPRGWTLTWDLAGTVAENYPQEMWDELSLWTSSGDGIQLARVMVVHSGVEIVDWSVNRWLDSPNYTSLGLGGHMLERKLQHVGNSEHAAISFAARELGKTNGYKYGRGGQWCSEFASWCLWKEGFWTPAGNIGTDDMKAWFQARNRLYTRSQVTSESYVCKEGDYLSLFDGGHSALFVEWIDGTTNITNSTRFRTIEGNTGSRVAVRVRTVADIDRVGKAQ